MSGPTLSVQRLPHAADLPAPAYATDGAAGLDLRAAVDAPVTLAPGARQAIPTGFAIAIPQGYEGQIRARSGRALRDGLGVLNAPGTIDSDYRGELLALVVNWGDKPVEIAPGERVAQLVIAPVGRAAIASVDVLPETRRGAGGFGHTGQD
ncbi:MAG: dUTP diphosphatase [Pseudomonadota bacterium]